MLNELSEIVEDSNLIVIGGDFNAKSKLWSSAHPNKRGEIMKDWAATYDLRLVNTGNTPTCVRPQGVSIVDLTWTSSTLINRITEWKVIEDAVTYSDHRYITCY